MNRRAQARQAEQGLARWTTLVTKVAGLTPALVNVNIILPRSQQLVRYNYAYSGYLYNCYQPQPNNSNICFGACERKAKNVAFDMH
jgi:hypothetical protein